MLSDRQVKALKGENRMVGDGGGLYVRLSRFGTKSFVYRTKKGGATRYATLGEYPNLSLAQARAEAQKLQGKAIGDYDVAYAVAEYLKHIKNEFEHPEQVEERLARDILPAMGEKRLSLITTKDLTDALQKIVDRGAPIAANRTLADVRHVFQYAFEKGWVANDVSERITRKVVGGSEASREIVLTDNEICELIEVMKTDRFEVKTRIAVLLLLVTGQRSSEILGIRRDEVDGRWWTIPGERTKNKKPQKVYLTHIALWLFKQVNFSLGGDHRTLSRAFSRMKVRYIPRDLRRTMATKLSENAVAPHVVEKMLNHQMEGVMAVYNRAEYIDERKAAWRLWARYIERLL